MTDPIRHRTVIEKLEELTWKDIGILCLYITTISAYFSLLLYIAS